MRDYSRRFDGWDPPSFKVDEAEIAAARDKLAPEVRASLEFAHAQVKHFAELQRASMLEFEEETRPGVFLGQKHIPVGSVGAYVPSGKYPMLMSAQMSILTAKVAGVPRVIGCAPPYGGAGIYPEVLWSMHLAGADEIYAVGGVQALAMLAYGVDGLDPVDLIAGPGNMYVAEAKRQLFGTVGIDLLAGPTEILIIADEAADPVVVAADLLGQAEHGPTSPAVLVTTSRPLADAVLAEVDRQLPLLPVRRGHPHVVGAARRGRRWRTTATRRSGSPTASLRSTSRCRPPTPTGTASACATTARCAWARRPPSPSATRPSARTTRCRRPGPPATPAASGSASSSRR